MRSVCLLSLFLLLAATAGYSAELRSVKVDRVDGVYRMQSEIWLDASLDATYAVFLDWDVSQEFSSTIIDSRDLEADESGLPGFYIKHRGCVLFFCTSFERRGHVEHEATTWIRATANPDESDFHLSNEYWSFSEDGEGTVVSYDLEFKPKFWVPPLIGPYMIKRKLANDGGGAIDRIEAIAQERQ